MTSEQFKLWRKSLGWSQRRVGEELGITYVTVGQFERGKRWDNDNPVKIRHHYELACRYLSHIHKVKFPDDPSTA